MLTRCSKCIIVQAVIDKHHSLRVALVLAIHIAALRLDVICCNLPPKKAASWHGFCCGTSDLDDRHSWLQAIEDIPQPLTAIVLGLNF